MRRSLDFGTPTGSLLPSSHSSSSNSRSGTPKSTSNSRSVTPNGSNSNSHSNSNNNHNGSGKFETISGGVLSPIFSSLSSTVGGGSNGSASGGSALPRRVKAHAHFALGSLFNNGNGKDSNGDIGNVDKYSSGASSPQVDSSAVSTSAASAALLHNAQHASSPTLNSLLNNNTDSGNEKGDKTYNDNNNKLDGDSNEAAEKALMKAVEAAKAKNTAWDIVVQLAKTDGLFLEFGSSRKDRDKGSSNGSSRNPLLLPGEMSRSIVMSAGRLLGKRGQSNSQQLRRQQQVSAQSQPLSPSSSTEGTSPIVSPAPMSPPPPLLSEEGPPTATTSHTTTTASPVSPSSKLKRRLESSGEEELNNINIAAHKRDDGATNSFALKKINDSNPLLVLYVTTGTASLTLYRGLQEVVKLDAELRKHVTSAMTATSRPSILLSVPGSPLSPTQAIGTGHGHARKRSVLSTLTRPFGGSPSVLRKASPGYALSSSASQSSVSESNASNAPSEATSTGLPRGETVTVTSATTSQYPMLQAQLSNLSDYLASLSCIESVRTSRQWKNFFKPRKEDHESTHLEQPVLSSKDIKSTDKGRRLKRIKSDTGLGNHSTTLHNATSDVPPIPRLPPQQQQQAQKQDASSGRTTQQAGINDSGIGSDRLGYSIGLGHARDQSSNRSVDMMRQVSSGTTTSASAMSIFIEHTEDLADGPVGDPEVLEYMERLRQESEARMRVPTPLVGFKNADNTQIVKDSYVPPTPISPVHEESDKTPVAALIEEPPVEDTPSAEVPQDDSIDAHGTAPAGEHDDVDAEPEGREDTPPPLTGTTAVTEDTSADHMLADDTPEATIAETNSRAELRASEPSTEENTSLPEPSRQTRPPTQRQSTRSVQRQNRGVSDRYRSRRSSVRIDDFEILRVLGKGCAGKVLLARIKDATTTSSSQKGALYAIKAIHKHHVLAHRELAHTLTEQSILRKMATESPNPFVVKMRWSFQDKDNLFLALDFHPGGDLATQLSRWGRLGKDRTRFYAAEIVEGLESLHAAGVIYRDLKPENILLAADGHIVLTDFGLSKQFNRPPPADAQNGVAEPSWLRATGKRYSSSPTVGSSVNLDPETTTTFCGTAEYLAPEVLLGNPYTFPVDMWSLGTMIYEMLLGVTPFYNEDHGIMYRRVLHEQLSFGPTDYLDGDTRALLRGLLQKEPEFRMTTARVKRCKYFEAIDWQYVGARRYIPPFIPNLSPDDPADTQNFEDCFLTMDLGFVDDKETEEIEAKAKASGKEPDKAVDEEGRDVFAGYTFDEAWANDDDETDGVGSEGSAGIGSEIEEEEGEEEEEDGQENQEEEGVERDATHHNDGVQQADVCETHEVVPAISSPGQVFATASLSREASATDTWSSEDPDRTQEDGPGYETGVTSAAMSDEALSKSSLNGEDETATLPSASAEAHATLSIDATKATHVEQERGALASDSLSKEDTGQILSSSPVSIVSSPQVIAGEETMPRNSIESEDWDVVEELGNHEVAVNGPTGPRKRLMAETSLFAKGIVDKYKLQIRPSRVPTPTRSHTARSPLARVISGSAQASSANLHQLSPTPSMGGMSESPSSLDSSNEQHARNKQGAKSPGRRLGAPRLLRASTDWIGTSLPSSPTPKFRMKRGKKSTTPSGSSKPFLEPAEAVTDTSTTPVSADSLATLSADNPGLGLHPLTRQYSRDRQMQASNNDGATVNSSPESIVASGPISEQRRGPKLKRFLFDGSRRGMPSQT